MNIEIMLKSIGQVLLGIALTLAILFALVACQTVPGTEAQQKQQAYNFGYFLGTTSLNGLALGRSESEFAKDMAIVRKYVLPALSTANAGTMTIEDAMAMAAQNAKNDPEANRLIGSILSGASLYGPGGIDGLAKAVADYVRAYYGRDS